MAINLSTLSIQEVYAHPVPLPGSGSVPKLSRRASNINNDTRSRIENDLRTTLTRQMLDLHIAEPAVSPVYAEVSSLIHSKKGNLKAVSIWLARKLFGAQTGNSSDGMLLVARATCDDKAALALLKVENESRVAMAGVGDGEDFSYDLDEIGTLSMDKKKVFKAALFVATKDEEENDGIEILASDHQASGRDGREMADFFLKDFLECTYVRRPAVVMQQAVDTIMNHISTIEAPADVKTAMANALFTTLDSEDTIFDIDAYTSDFVPEETKAVLDAKLKKAGVVASEIEKDRSELEQSKYLLVVLSNGLRIIGPKDMLSDMVSAAETDDGLQELHIMGTIVKYNLRKKL